MPEVVITECHDVTPEVVDAFRRLIPQLSSSNPPPPAEQLEQIVRSPATALFLARDGDGGPILGTLTLAFFRIPTAVRAWIEDVVVDADASGRSIGRSLSLAAIERARTEGAKTVELTSRPSREAANHIYDSIGFVRRDTNVYRMDLE